jgi:hypothetical protein
MGHRCLSGHRGGHRHARCTIVVNSWGTRRLGSNSLSEEDHSCGGASQMGYSSTAKGQKFARAVGSRPFDNAGRLAVIAWVAMGVACGARTALDVGLTSGLPDESNAGALNEGRTEVDGAEGSMQDAGGSRRPCSSYMTLHECTTNGCGACIDAVGMRTQQFICYEGSHGCESWSDGAIRLFP